MAGPVIDVCAGVLEVIGTPVSAHIGECFLNAPCHLQKEEVATKRLIDSLQGGVTFFRPGGSGGPMGARGAASGQAPETGCELPLVVCALEEVRDVAHLEAIRSDKEGRSRLDTLLKAERMSAADLKRQLAKVSAKADRRCRLCVPARRGNLELDSSC